MYKSNWLRNLKGRDCLEGLFVDGGIILKCLFEKLDVGLWPEVRWLRMA
jgi:hypothetical protein